MNHHFSFRELREVNELCSAFRLRFQHFNRPNYQRFLKQTNIPLDLDQNDFHARHWGLFLNDHQLIGCARIIDNSRNDAISPLLMELIEKYDLPLTAPKTTAFQVEGVACPDHMDKASSIAPNFPIISYQPPQRRAEISKLLRQNVRYKQIELSRFVVKKGYSFRLAKFMINSGLGIYRYCYQTDLVLLACRTTHERFWSHYSFKRIGQPYEVHQLPSVNLYSELPTVPVSLQEQFEKQAEEYSRNQQTILTL